MAIIDDFITIFLAEAIQNKELRVSLHLSTGATITGWVEIAEGGVATIETDDGLMTHVRIPHIITANYI